MPHQSEDRERLLCDERLFAGDDPDADDTRVRDLALEVRRVPVYAPVATPCLLPAAGPNEFSAVA